jgi:hypothetical protein
MADENPGQPHTAANHNWGQPPQSPSEARSKNALARLEFKHLVSLDYGLVDNDTLDLHASGIVQPGQQFRDTDLRRRGQFSGGNPLHHRLLY